MIDLTKLIEEYAESLSPSPDFLLEEYRRQQSLAAPASVPLYQPYPPQTYQGNPSQLYQSSPPCPPRYLSPLQDGLMPDLQSSTFMEEQQYFHAIPGAPGSSALGFRRIMSTSNSAAANNNMPQSSTNMGPYTYPIFLDWQPSTSYERPGGYMPQGSGYMMQGSSYIPQGSSYVPQGSSYVPQGSSYVPQGSSYVPQGSSYVPQGSNYMPQGSSYVPLGSSYVPQGNSYVLQGSSYVPQGTSYLLPGSSYLSQRSSSLDNIMSLPEWLSQRPELLSQRPEWFTQSSQFNTPSRSFNWCDVEPNQFTSYATAPTRTPANIHVPSPRYMTGSLRVPLLRAPPCKKCESLHNAFKHYKDKYTESRKVIRVLKYGFRKRREDNPPPNR